MTNTSAYHRCTAFLALLGALLLIAGVMMSGFGLSHQFGPEIAARTAQLSALRGHLERLSLKPESGETPGDRSTDAAGLFLPDSTPGSAGAILQSRLISLTAKAGGRVASARVAAPTEQDRLKRISVEISAEVKVNGLRDLLYAVETAKPLMVVDRLGVRRIAPEASGASTSRAQQDPSLKVVLRVSSYLNAGTGDDKP